MHIEDRIKELRRVPAKDLIPNPKNWRLHPEQQINALRGVLSEVGWADAVLARETPAGLQIIDGHARAETANDSIVPVLILDVNQEEADKILATLDPLAAMAEADAGKLEDLLSNLETNSKAVLELFNCLREDNGIEAPDFLPSSAEEQGRLDSKPPVTCPHCGKDFVP